MADLLGDFRWRVPSEGFQWERGAYRLHFNRASRGGFTASMLGGVVENEFTYAPGATEFLVPRGINFESTKSNLDVGGHDRALPLIFAGHDAREYAPLTEYPALFREFAFVEQTAEGFLSFANLYGALGSEGTCEFVHSPTDRAKGWDTPDGWGEVIGAWFTEAGRMHDGVAIWDAVRREDEDFLSHCMWYENEDRLVYWEPLSDQWHISGEELLAAPDHHPERLEQIRERGVLRAGLFIVQDLINEGLRTRVHERLMWADDRLAISLIPSNLIGALWLQFAHSVAADVDFAKCVECGTWFEVAPGSGRPDKRYCSDACRMRAYRKRKAAKSRKNKAVR